MKETFGEYMKRNRKLNGYTLTQLAAKLNLDSANLSKIENGKRDLDLKRLKSLSIELNLDFDQVKQEYFSDFVAKKLYENNCNKEVLFLAEEKMKYYKSKNK